MKRLIQHILIPLLLTAFFFAATPFAHAHDASYYAPASAMASGHWARVRITGHGVHQITYDQLRNLGFDSPEEVKVCGFGGNLLSDNIFSTERPDDLKASPCVHTADGRLLFYGEPDVRATITSIGDDSDINISVSRNVYSLDTYYLLTDAPLPVPAATSAADMPPTPVTLDSHFAVDLFEPEEENPGRGGAAFYSHPCVSTQKLKMPFNVYGFNPDGVAYLGLRAVASEYSTYGYYQITVSAPSAFSSRQLTPIAFDVKFDRDYLYDISTGGYRIAARDAAKGVADGTHTFTLNWIRNDYLEYGALDYAWLAYTRHNVIDSSRPGGLIMQHAGTDLPARLVIRGAHVDALVWDVTDPGNITPAPCEHDAAAATVDAAVTRQGTAVLIAFNPADTHLPVIEAGTPDNQNIHGMDVPHMVIITTDELYDAACELADIHRRHDGIDVAVITQSRIFNEFGGGNASAMAYRRMVKMFYDRNPQRLRWLMLYGSASWDNRGITGAAPYERLLCYEVEPQGPELTDAVRHSILNFTSDDYFGIVADGYDPERLHRSTVQIAVGRVPLENTTQAREFNRKIDTYLSAMPGADVASRVLLMSDDGDLNQHMQQSEYLAETMLAAQPHLTMHRAYVGLYPLKSGVAAEARKIVSNALIKGVGYFSYTGHGRSTYLSAENIWSQNMAQSTSYGCPPLGVFSTCDTYELDRNTPGLAEMMVKRLNGGTIASVAAARAVFLKFNPLVSYAMARSYASARPGATVGDIYLAAHNDAITDASPTSNALSRYNTMCFNLCGDPAVRITVPSLKARVTALNGTDISAGTPLPVDVEPMTRVCIAGEICTADGAVDSSFSGTASLTLYDGARTTPVFVRNLDDEAGDVTLDESTLAATAVTVKDGRWEAVLPVPFGTYDSTHNRLVITATEDAAAGNRAAAGLFDGIHVTSDSQHTFTGNPPAISDFYIGTPSFADGDIVGADFDVHALVTLGEGGLNRTDAIGGASRLTLDGRHAIDGADGAITINADGTATLNMHLSDIEDGRHTLTLTVADFTGRRASSTIAFTVRAQADTNPVLTLSTPLARQEVTISLTASDSSDISDISDSSELRFTSARLMVRDIHGNTVFTLSNPGFPYTWDLTDAAGNTLPDGRYTLWAILSTPARTYTSTPATPLTILH